MLITTVSARMHLFCISRIQQVIWVLDFSSHLLFNELSDSVCNWLRDKFQTMFTFFFFGVKETLVLIKMSIYLLNLWHFPAEVLLRLRKTIRLCTCLHFSFALQGYVPGIAIELLAQSFFRLCIVVARLIAIVLFPSFCLSSRHHRQLLCKNAIFEIIVCCLG